MLLLLVLAINSRLVSMDSLPVLFRISGWRSFYYEFSIWCRVLILMVLTDWLLETFPLIVTQSSGTLTTIRNHFNHMGSVANN